MGWSSPVALWYQTISTYIHTLRLDTLARKDSRCDTPTSGITLDPVNKMFPLPNATSGLKKTLA